MKRKNLYIWIIVAVAVAALAAGVWYAVQPRRQELRLFSELRDMQSLVLAEMSLNKVGEISDEGATGVAAVVNSLKIGKRVAVYSYNTYLEAYMDLSELTAADVAVDGRGRFAKLVLPPVRTRFVGRDMEVVEEHYRVSGLRSDVSPRERSQLKELMNASLKKEVEGNDEYRRMLTEQARAKAVGFFTALLRGRGYECEVSVRE
ncbi:MAG: DUF4230 domain-containing protein [Muribaculaceae bacterium]|jgi:hypothetical protein